MIFKSITYGDVEIKDIVRIIHKHQLDNPDGDYSVIVGTDSQNFHTTKVVIVIAVIRVTKGGFFFYHIDKIDRIQAIQQKLHYETTSSLVVMEELMQELSEYSKISDFDYTDLSYSIHVDAGKDGPSGKYIPEVVGWIKACGYIADVKPDSFVASSIADKFSK